MKKFSLKRLLSLIAVVLPLQLMALQPFSERVGGGSSSLMTPLSQSKSASHFSMPETFRGGNGLRTSLTTLAAGPALAKQLSVKGAGGNINMVGNVVYSQNLKTGFYTIPTTGENSLMALNNTSSGLPETNFGAVAIDGVYYVAWQ